MGNDNQCSSKSTLSPRQYAECLEGETQFSKEVETHIHLRQRLATGTELDSLESELQTNATKLKSHNAESQQKCKNDYTWKSCGYAMAYERFEKYFGSLNQIARPKQLAATVLNLYPLKSGELIADLEPASSGLQVLFDTGCSVGLYANHWINSHLDMFSASDIINNTDLVSYDISNLVFTMGNIHFKPSSGVGSQAVDYLEGTDKQHQLISIIGEDFLAERAYEVNYDTSKMTIEVDVQSRLQQGKWDHIPISVGVSHGSIAFVFGMDILLNGHQQRMIFDTGATLTAITAQCASQYQGLQLSEGPTANIATGSMRTEKAHNVSVELGNSATIIPELPIVPTDNPITQTIATLGYCGVLGLDIIKQHNFIYDPHTFMLYLANRKKSTPLVSHGFSFHFDEKKSVVSYVDQKSAIEKAGLKKGDLILEINGQRLSELTSIQIFELSKDSKILTLKIFRNGKEIALTLDPDYAQAH